VTGVVLSSAKVTLGFKEWAKLVGGVQSPWDAASPAQTRSKGRAAGFPWQGQRVWEQ